jgi:hypothetical protein
VLFESHLDLFGIDTLGGMVEILYHVFRPTSNKKGIKLILPVHKKLGYQRPSSLKLFDGFENYVSLLTRDWIPI